MYDTLPALPRLPPFLVKMCRISETTLPRLASRAPFLCLMGAHLECPDIGSLLQPSGGCESTTRPGNKKAPTLAASGLHERYNQAASEGFPRASDLGGSANARG